MPLFKSHNEPEPVHHSTNNSSPSRKGTLFGRRRSVSSERSPNEHNHSQRGGGLFGNSHRRSSSSDGSPTHPGTGSVRSGGSGGFFGLGGHNSAGNDPSIMAARQKVQEAEQAEREADHALNAARASVREAREHVRFLEKDAADDARRAKAKQAEAKVVSKTARALGRHG
ncbi:hypothetical protein E1B28_000258 [Marasmius oreades]|uniref:Uncharacterized protein n=1 Tax=Marasmius oreades TaxID=181124 RepID=A0A9P7V126_9AGAR|nr:uncharacterized protein E1B28_000258 [Marasmius oreades]KAG7098296.1 hypothetical protein E1B28_000258 [Marasmius oreades]